MRASGRIAWLVTAIGSTLSLGCGESPPSKAATVAVAAQPAAGCLPPGVGPARRAANAGPAPLSVYLDGSFSMAGFARGGAQGDVKALGDTITLIRDHAGDLKGALQVSAFGKTIAPVPADAVARYATPAGYECSTCDNSQSRVDEVLRLVSEGASGTLYVIVSDLWLDNRAVIGSHPVVLGGPLRRMLEQGRSVQVIGVRAPFDGFMYDLPGGKFRHVGERPLFVLLIGPVAAATTLRKALLTSGSPAFTGDRVRYSIFSTQPADPWRTQGAVIPVGPGMATGSVVREGLPAWVTQHRMTREARPPISAISATLNAAVGVDPGAVWIGPVRGVDAVWKLTDERALRTCDPSAWKPNGTLQNAWTMSGQAPAGVFRFTPETARGLTPGSYLVAPSLVSPALQRPNPASAWMREWSLSTDQLQSTAAARPRWIRALGVGSLADQMEAAQDAAAPNGRVLAATAFLAKVER